MDLEALKEDIRCAMDGLGGSEIARAAACVAMEDLEPAQGGNWDWVQTVLSGCPIAKEAAIPTPVERNVEVDGRTIPIHNRTSPWQQPA